jgi:hypothetical protein
MSGTWIADGKCDVQLRSKESRMLGELTDISTDALIDMLYIILAGEIAITASDAKEIEQIQRELQRRGHEQCWTFQTVN